MAPAEIGGRDRCGDLIKHAVHGAASTGTSGVSARFWLACQFELVAHLAANAIASGGWVQHQHDRAARIAVEFGNGGRSAEIHLILKVWQFCGNFFRRSISLRRWAELRAQRRDRNAPIGALKCHVPHDKAAPVVPDKCGARHVEEIQHGAQVGDQVLVRIVLGLGRARREAKPGQVDGEHAVVQRQCGDLVAPAIAEIGPTVYEHHRAGAARVAICPRLEREHVQLHDGRHLDEIRATGRDVHVSLMPVVMNETFSNQLIRASAGRPSGMV